MKEEASHSDLGPVVDAYMRDIDRTLLRENLKLSHEERAAKHQRALAVVEELRRAGNIMRREART